MYDSALVWEILRQTLRSAQTILKRFELITCAGDFVASDEGAEKLDAICMQLITIGESIKNLDKVTGGTLLPHYPEIDWKRVMGMRDILTHHYFDIDVEGVYSVCEKYEDLVQPLLGWAASHTLPNPQVTVAFAPERRAA